MAIGNLYTAHFRFESPSSGFTVGMSYRQLSGTNDANTLTDLCAALATLLQVPFKGAVSNQVSMTAILAFQVTGADETPGRTVFQQPNLGTVASEALPMGACAVLSILTVAPNSKFNGRMFLSGIGEGVEVEGAISAGGLVVLNTLAAALQVNPPAIGPGLAVFQPTVISRVLDGVPRVPPVGFDIVSITPDAFIKNQRRRNTKFLGPGVTT